MKVFFDTSALAKRYIQEKGSEAVNDLFGPSKKIVVSMICMTEVFSAINRLCREKHINTTQYVQLKDAILQEFQQFEVCEISPEVIGRSVTLLEKYSLRALDALHLASALHVKPVVFVSSDIEQIAVARDLRLKVIVV